MFSVENGLLTPTLKSKRPMLKAHFKQEIEAMYANLDQKGMYDDKFDNFG